jgi:hypothetical protein
MSAGSGKDKDTMTPRKPGNPDAITHAEAAAILGVHKGSVRRLIRDGILHRVPGQHPTLSKTEAEEQVRNPQQSEWITGTEAAEILDISKTRVWQLALKDLLPWELADNGRRRYRRSQIEVISRARQIKWHPIED